MDAALVIGGTGFLGRHTVETFLARGYDVASISRSAPDVPFAEAERVDHRIVDRTDVGALREIATEVAPDVVIDCAAFYPADVQTATDVFGDVEAYVYVSSGGVYRREELPKREDETPLHRCTPEQADDDTVNSYGPRKAEGDRIARAAAENGIPATSVRPCVLYGPRAGRPGNGDVDGPEWIGGLPVNHLLHDYWIERVDRFDRVIVPGDGTAIWHRAYVEDVAEAVRVVAERGEAGAAYNVGDGRVCTLEDVLESIADALGTTVEPVYTSRRELAEAGLDPGDFILYHHPATGYPHVLDTCRLRRLGWRSTPVGESMRRTVEARIDRIRDLEVRGPHREAEERLLAELDG